MSKNNPDFSKIAREMFKRAIIASAQQLGVQGPNRVLEELSRGDCDRCQVLRFNLARQVAEFLATQDSDLRAVYSYNPDYAFGDYQSTSVQPSLSSAVHLMVWTRTLKSAPADAIEGLSNAFLRARKKVVCPKSSEMCLSLNLKVVNDAQVRARAGYAAIIESLNVRPNQVWARNGAAD